MLEPWTNDAGSINFENLPQVMNKLFGPDKIRRFIPNYVIRNPEDLLSRPYILIGSKGSGKTLLLRCKEAILKQFEEELSLVFAPYAHDLRKGHSILLTGQSIRIPARSRNMYRSVRAWFSLFYFLIACMSLIRLARHHMAPRYRVEETYDEFCRVYLQEASPVQKDLVGEVWRMYAEDQKGEFLSRIISRLVQAHHDFHIFESTAELIDLGSLPGDRRFVILIDSIDESFCDENGAALVENIGEFVGGKGDGSVPGKGIDVADTIEIWTAIQCGLADAVIKLWEKSNNRIVAYATVRGELKSAYKGDAQLKDYTLSLEYTRDDLESVFDSNVQLWMEVNQRPPSEEGHGKSAKVHETVDPREQRLKAFFRDGCQVAGEDALSRVLRHALPYPRCVVEIGREISELSNRKRQSDVRSAIERGARISCQDHLLYAVPSFLPNRGDEAEAITKRKIELLREIFKSNVIYKTIDANASNRNEEKSNHFGLQEDQFQTLIRLRQLGLIGIPIPAGGGCELDFYEDSFDGGKSERTTERIATARERLMSAPYLVAHSALAAYLGSDMIKVDRRIRPGERLPCPPQLYRPSVYIYVQNGKLMLKIDSTSADAEGQEKVVEVNDRYAKLAVSVLICAAALCKDEVSNKEVKANNDKMQMMEKRFRFNGALKDQGAVKHIASALKPLGLNIGVRKKRQLDKEHDHDLFAVQGVHASQIYLADHLEFLNRYGNSKITAE
ncbi:hypothetical protein [Lysobacter brunescens]|uniref:Uncharacterized protein n=1 Tax=Lysobacter brunescens TaxID=262323 RepID=A0ABW2YCE8_9GAMM